ncbi:MAG: Rieske 2Fe-2S domain-containing protein [Gemmatimonadetes bacterium]|nr:Rieske 2Fe-2S domain-containing protein [Gemmatimonadota bacterium]MBI3569209.1 Rieske 2Fe-2S domain-containing protein [Gemmatimonadota bacterium]
MTPADMESGELRGVRLQSGVRVCVGRSGSEYFAVCEECPHSGFPLSNGTLLDGGVLECGWHGARFAIADGAVLAGPAREPVKRFRVVVEDGFVFVGDSSGS